MNSAQDKHSRRYRAQKCHRARSRLVCNNLFMGSDSLVPFCLRRVGLAACLAAWCSSIICLQLSRWSPFQCTCPRLCSHIAAVAASSRLSSPKIYLFADWQKTRGRLCSLKSKDNMFTHQGASRQDDVKRIGMKEWLWIRKDRVCSGKLWVLVDSHWLPDLKVKDPTLAPQSSTANWLNKHASLLSPSDMNWDALCQV